MRVLRKRPAFTTAAVVTLALGIGATTTVFSVSEVLLLRPLAYPEADRLVTIQSHNVLRDVPNTRASRGVLAEWQNDATSFEALAGYRWHTMDLVGDGQSERLKGLGVTPEFFDVFGVAVRGRTFRAEDRGASTLVLSDDVWRRRLDASESAIGGTVDVSVRNFDRVGPTQHTIVGVATAPVRFPPLAADFQLGLSSVVDTVDFWFPRRRKRIWTRSRGNRRCSFRRRTAGGTSGSCHCGTASPARARATSRSSASAPASCCSSPAPMSPPCFLHEERRASVRSRSGPRSARHVGGSCGSS